MIPDYVSILYISSDPFTPPMGGGGGGGEINWCQTWLGNTQGVIFSQFAFCIPRLSADIFTHTGKIFGSHAETAL